MLSAPVCAELHNMSQGHKHACVCLTTAWSMHEHNRDSSRGNPCAGPQSVLVVRLLGAELGADPPPALTPLTALLLWYHSALGK